MVGHGGSSAGSYLADPTSPIPSHCASIVVTSTVRVNLKVPPPSSNYTAVTFLDHHQAFKATCSNVFLIAVFAAKYFLWPWIGHVYLCIVCWFCLSYWIFCMTIFSLVSSFFFYFRSGLFYRYSSLIKLIS